MALGSARTANTVAFRCKLPLGGFSIMGPRYVKAMTILNALHSPLPSAMNAATSGGRNESPVDRASGARGCAARRLGRLGDAAVRQEAPPLAPILLWAVVGALMWVAAILLLVKWS